MDASHLASLMLALPEGLRLSDLTVVDTVLLVQVFSTHPLACCPDCGHPSSRVHSRYVRTVGDLPCAGRQVVLKLTVRKFLCPALDCPRTMFTERLPDHTCSRHPIHLLALRHGRRLLLPGQAEVM